MAEYQIDSRCKYDCFKSSVLSSRPVDNVASVEVTQQILKLLFPPSTSIYQVIGNQNDACVFEKGVLVAGLL